MKKSELGYMVLFIEHDPETGEVRNSFFDTSKEIRDKADEIRKHGFVFNCERLSNNRVSFYIDRANENGERFTFEAVVGLIGEETPNLVNRMIETFYARLSEEI